MPTALDLSSGVASLATLANADLTVIWQSVNDAVQARDALADVLPALVETYGSAAASLAADWYDELRDGLGIGGRFTAIVPDLGDGGGDALAGWGVGPLFQESPNWAGAQMLIAGGLQRRIANASRATVTTSSIQDPGADGWQRTGRGACAFCAMLIGRGAVYSESTADFASHDHCHCGASPAFTGRSRPVRAYTPTTRDITPADRARVRAWITNNP